MRIDESLNCVVHTACWAEHLRLTTLSRLYRGIRIAGALWTEFQAQREEKKSLPQNSKYRHRFGRNNTLDFAETCYVATYHPGWGHLFTRRSEAGVDQLFDEFGVSNLLEPRRYPEKDEVQCTDAALGLRGTGVRAGEVEEVPPPVVLRILCD